MSDYTDIFIFRCVQSELRIYSNQLKVIFFQRGRVSRKTYTCDAHSLRILIENINLFKRL